MLETSSQQHQDGHLWPVHLSECWTPHSKSGMMTASGLCKIYQIKCMGDPWPMAMSVLRALKSHQLHLIN